MKFYLSGKVPWRERFIRRRQKHTQRTEGSAPLKNLLPYRSRGGRKGVPRLETSWRKKRSVWRIALSAPGQKKPLCGRDWKGVSLDRQRLPPKSLETKEGGGK